MINNIVIMGRLTSMPELKTTTNGVAVTGFTVAVDRKAKSKDGNRTTDFLPVVAWRGTAEFVTRYFGKGQMIAVAGELQARKYQDRDGNNRIAYEIIASEVSFCGDSSKSNNSGSTEKVTPELHNYGDANFEELSNDDELPF